jgi:hypothetical protein
MSHFWMHQSVQQGIVDDGPASDSCADSEVQEIGQSDGGTPTPLAQSGSVDICIETHWHSQLPGYYSCDVKVPPSRLRG